jgi:class 3 adenylate cyclase/ATP/maltotriose-dependent transcriptional regulator MalT
VERKLATVLFVDLVGSTSFVSSSDPEVVRRRVTRFFDGVSHCVVSHGGIVEKFAGDAVMAAFGIPQAHEDDAERAIRAALAILDAVHDLGLEARVGVESGEVVADDTDSTFATGEAVNVAARLQQEAEPGEILLGPTAHRLTFGRVVVEDRGPLELRGLAASLPTWRVVAVTEEPGRAVSVNAPFVGREEELELLENTFARAAGKRRAHLFTIYGEPGVGKSRLAREFLSGVEGATILAGRSLPYGEGITYWPLAEMVKAAAGITDDEPAGEAFEKLRACCAEDAVADLLGLAAGVLELVEGERSAQEIAWAAREWAAELADVQPLILVFEDIHWAEEPLLDLVEHLAERVREAPLLILCLARPELLDIRPGWGGGRLRATAIELEPLAPAESEELIDALLDEELPASVRTALLGKTEGNPLFVEETIRMLAEQPADATAADRIPDTIQALIAARIDRLPRGEKAVLQRAAAIGRVFWEGAITQLSPDVEDVEPVLENLLLRDFLLPEARSTISGQRAFRFKHVLIRDVAYAGLSKGSRADLHAGFAAWLEERTADELLEIRAYHLDRAATLVEELDGAVPAELAAEAASAMEAAGRRALQRQSNRSARKLLRRSVELEPTLERRFWAARAAWRVDDLPAVSTEMELVRAAAREAGEAELEGRALTALADVALLRDADLPRGRELIEQALELLDGAGSVARFEALTMRARIDWWLGDLESDERYTRLALAVAQEIGSSAHEAEANEELAGIAMARLDVDAAAELAERALQLADESGNHMTRAWALVSLARVERSRVNLDEANSLFDEARELFEETGSAWALGRTLEGWAWVAIRAGDLATAERRLRDAIRILAPIEDRGALCEAQRALAEVLVRTGELDEAERWAVEARKTVGPHDQVSRATTRLALGLVRAAQGRDEEAEGLFAEAMEIVRGTGNLNTRVDMARKVAGYLRERGREAEAAAYEDEAGALMPVPA